MNEHKPVTKGQNQKYVTDGQYKNWMTTIFKI